MDVIQTRHRVELGNPWPPIRGISQWTAVHLLQCSWNRVVLDKVPKTRSGLTSSSDCISTLHSSSIPTCYTIRPCSSTCRDHAEGAMVETEGPLTFQRTSGNIPSLYRAAPLPQGRQCSRFRHPAQPPRPPPQPRTSPASRTFSTRWSSPGTVPDADTIR